MMQARENISLDLVAVLQVTLELVSWCNSLFLGC